MTWLLFGKILLAVGMWFLIAYAVGRIIGKIIELSSRNYAPIIRRTHLRHPYRRRRW